MRGGVKRVRLRGKGGVLDTRKRPKMFTKFLSKKTKDIPLLQRTPKLQWKKLATAHQWRQKLEKISRLRRASKLLIIIICPNFNGRSSLLPINGDKNLKKFRACGAL